MPSGGSNKIDLKNRVFNQLTVIEPAPNKGKKTYWKCLCSCGKKCVIQTSDITCNKRKDCGHSHAKYMHTKRTINIVGYRSGKVVVIEMLDAQRANNRWRSRVKCLCDCGRQFVTRKENITSGDTQSCGCQCSHGQLQCMNYLQHYGINYKRQYSFCDCLTPKGARCYFDFGILDKDNKLIALIEYQGSQHKYTGRKRGTNFQHFGQYQKNITDPIKKTYCQQHKIPLIEIWFNENVQDKIKSIFNTYVNPVPSLGNKEGATTIP